MIRRRQPPVEAEEQGPQGFDSFELRLGDVMRGERATLGKSLLDVQRELKIKATYIAAIENTDPEAFETPGFIAGYVRSYARYLGLDPEWAYARFCDEGDFATVSGMEPQASGPAAARRVEKPAERKDPLSDPNAAFVPRGEAFLSRIEPGAVGSSLVLLALIGALGFGGWSVLQEIQRVNMTPVDQAPGVLAEVDPLAGAGTDTAATGGEGFDVAAAPTVEALDRLYRPQALDVPVLEARDGPIARLAPGSIGALATPGAPAAAVVAEAQVPDALPQIDKPVKVVEDHLPEVAIFAMRPAWVRVRAADGTILFEKILDAGTSYVLPQTEEPPVLRAGNSGAVFFAVNGEAYGPAAPGAAVVKNVALDVATLKDSYQPVDPTAEPAVATMVAELRAQWQTEEGAE